MTHQNTEDLDIIAAIVGNRMGYGEREILSHRRHRGLVLTRWVIYYLSQELTAHSFPEIARRFNRDHTTILYGVARARERIATNANYAALVESIKGMIQQQMNIGVAA